MKHFTLFLTFLLLVLTASAQQITSEQALQKAERFLNRSNAAKAKKLTNTKMALEVISQSDILGEVIDNPVAEGEEPCQQLYFFNIGNGDGFIIVSGDDRTPEIIGYSTEGSLNKNNMPENMRWLLTGIAKEIESLQQSGKALSPLTSNYQPIEKLISTQWSQGAPYNAETPIANEKKSPTGCVATAMAQMLNYLRPTGSEAIPAYTTMTYSIAREALPATTFDWSKMENTYSSSASAPEVAKLMHYCGQSVEMDYKGNSSGASSFDVPNAVAKYFGCSILINVVERAEYTRNDWNEMIYNELAEQRPVFLRGSNAEGGHAFICDGYDTDGLFHINWGWNGKSDGFFLLSALSPDEQGEGGTSSGYNVGLAAIVNWHLADASEKKTCVLTCADYPNNSFTESATRNADGSFSISITQAVFNLNEEATQYNFGWGLYNSAHVKKANFASSTVRDIPTNYGGYLTYNLTIASSYTDGTYYLIPISRTINDNTWSICNQSKTAELKMTISGNNLTLEKANPTVVESFTISNIKYSSDKFVGASLNVNMDVTNEGNTTTGLLYITDDASPANVLGTIALEIDPGETQHVSGSITLKKAGTQKFYVLNQSQNKRYGITIDVAEESLSKLTFTQTVTSESIPDENDNKIHLINSNSVDIQVKATNSASTSINPDKKPYRSTICWFLYKDTGDGSFAITSTRTYPLSLNNGYVRTINQTFSGLEKDVTYMLKVGYKREDGVYMVSADVYFRYTEFPTELNDNCTEYSNNKSKVVDFNYTRNFTNTNWQALYVPFGMTYDDWKDDFEMAYICDINEQDINGDGIADKASVEIMKMQEGDIIEPNTPYLIKAKTTGEKVISKQNTTLHKTEENTLEFIKGYGVRYNFTGTYHTVSDMASKQYYAMVDGSLKTAATNAATLKPFRWYLSITDNDGNIMSLPAKSITFVDVDDNATGINTVNAAAINSTDIYSVTGKKMGKDSTILTPGIYIKNNRKFIVK